MITETRLTKKFIIDETDTVEDVRDTHCLYRREKRQKQVERLLKRTLVGEARIETYKDRIAGAERVRAKKRARIERSAGDVLMEPGNRDDEQVAVRHADASGGDIIENQHEENRMRDNHIGKREEQIQQMKNNLIS